MWFVLSLLQNEVFMNFMGSAQGARVSYGYYDEGLRKYMLQVFQYMGGALGVSGLTALMLSWSPSMFNMIHATPLHWLFVLAPILLAIFMQSRVTAMSVSSLHTCYWSFAVLMGISLSSLFVVYTGMSIARVFFIAASVFGAMSVYGHTTKRDLTSMGSFLIMGVVGLILASLVNLFLRSPGLYFVTSFLGVLIFIGLTAYDVQRVKNIYYSFQGSGSDVMTRVSVLGALTLYFDFINLFIHLLTFFGDRK